MPYQIFVFKIMWPGQTPLTTFHALSDRSFKIHALLEKNFLKFHSSLNIQCIHDTCDCDQKWPIQSVVVAVVVVVVVVVVFDRSPCYQGFLHQSSAFSVPSYLSFLFTVGIGNFIVNMLIIIYMLFKSSNVQNLLKLLQELDYGNLMPEMKKKMGVTMLVSEISCVVNRAKLPNLVNVALIEFVILLEKNEGLSTTGRKTL